MTVLHAENYGAEMSKVYPLAKMQQRIYGKGVTELWTMQVTAWGKPVKDTGAQAWVTANEYICAALGTHIGLPIPPFAMLEKSTSGRREDLYFATLSYTKEGEDLPRINPKLVYQNVPEICAGVLAFDLWICNTDRHNGNLSFDPSVTPKRLNVFDHSHALLGVDGDMRRLGRFLDVFTLDETCESGANRHCLIDHLHDFGALKTWLNRISMLPNFQIQEACKNAEELGLIDCTERQAVVDFLLKRRKNLRELFLKNWTKFTSVITCPSML